MGQGEFLDDRQRRGLLLQVGQLKIRVIFSVGFLFILDFEMK
jgi:hypothetical protein